MSRIPKQKLPRSRKTKEWGKKSMNAFIDRTQFSSQHKSHMHKYYDAYNGNLAEADYNYVINPYNSEKHKTKGFPAKLRSYNIIKPVIDSTYSFSEIAKAHEKVATGHSSGKVVIRNDL